MRRNSAAAIVAVGGVLVLLGCGSREPSVYVDLSRLPPEPVIAWNYSVPSADLPTNTALAIRALPSTALGRELGPDKTVDWEQALKREREASLDRTRKLLEKRLLARARADEESRLSEMDPLRRQISDVAYAKARAIFEQYAEPIGILRVKLANRVGVPTPTSNVPRVRRPWYPATTEEVVALKRQIGQIEASYYRDLGAIIDQASAEADKLIASVRITTAVREDEALKEAKRIVDALRASTQGSRVATPIVDGRSRLDPVPGVQGRTGGPITGGSTSSFNATANLNPEARIAIRREAQLWAKRNGWKLSENSAGAMNKTEEFWKWRQQFLAGPLRN